MIDVIHQLNTVQRRVGCRVLEAGEARSLTMGWDLGLMGLGLHLASGQAVDRGAVEAWSASAEGKRFMALSSRSWSDASIAGGLDEEAARIAGERTTAFYTGSDANASAAPQS